MAASLGQSSLIRWRRRIARATAGDGDEESTSLDGRLTCLVSVGFLADRIELAELGGLAPSARDDQILLALLRRWGRHAPGRLQGPFSWVAWDGVDGCLLAGADRLGLRPLYFAESHDEVLIGSSPAAVAKARAASLVPDADSLLRYVNGGGAPADRSFYTGVERVAPGTVVAFDRVGTRRATYWRLDPRGKGEPAGPPAEELRELLDRVVRGYVGPGGLGIAISGGLDSTSVAAALRRALPAAELTAFNRAYPELPEDDESADAAAVAERLAMRLVSLRGDLHWPLSRPDGVVTPPDGPVYPPFYEPWELVWDEARRRGVRTLYTGGGGDHLFGGTGAYPQVDLLLRGEWVSAWSELRALRAGSEDSLGRFLGRTVLRPLARLVLPRWRPAGRLAAPWLTASARRDLRRMQIWKDAAPPAGRWLPPGRRDRFRWLTHLPSIDLVAAVDRLAAEHAIELRHPLLDARLFELAARLGAESSFAGGRRKAILRQAMRHELPSSVLDKRRKVLPIRIFRRGAVERESAKVKALMTGMRLADLGLVDQRRLREAYASYAAGQGDTLFWNAITAEDWLRRHF